MISPVSHTGRSATCSNRWCGIKAIKALRSLRYLSRKATNRRFPTAIRFQRLQLVVLFSLLCIASNAQSQFDGDFWLPKTQEQKTLHVVGFVDGRNHGINDAVEALEVKGKRLNNTPV